MQTGDRIQKLRKENNMTQENLAEYLQVSRQSISKWESNLSYPETDKLIKLSELFNVSIDYLLRGVSENKSNITFNKKYYHYEYISNKKFLGLPLIHINIGRGLYKAKGIIAIGTVAKGFISMGLFSLGFISFGLFTLGILALGLVTLGILSIGSISIGIFSLGAIAIGILSIGAISIGFFSIGALSIGKYIAIGDSAYGAIALGKSYARGNIYQNTGSYNKDLVLNLIDEHVPNVWEPIIKIIKLFIK